MVNPIQLLLSSPWFWIVLILIILIVAFRAQIARLVDRTQKANIEAGKDGAKLELDASAPAAERAHAAAPPSTPAPTQSVQVGQGAIIKDSAFGDIGNVIVKPASPAPTVAKTHGASSPATNWNTATIRELLMAAFSDEELTTLCFDHFRPVYQEFSAGMSMGQKTQRLLDHCERHDQFGKLLALVHERNPVQYARFEERLRG
jgi:hypothetical protein